MNIRDQLKQAIYGQESSSGRADTSQENYAGARGPMQVTKSTFEGMKANGLIPSDWTHDNPEQTKQAGFRLIDNLADKYGDDPRKVAAAYYAGEKAVRADGSIADYRDRKNPKAPTTLQYADQVLARMGITAPEAKAQATAERYDISNWRDTAMPGALPERAAKAPKEAAEPPAPESETPGATPLSDALAAQTKEQVAHEAERKDTSFLDSARAAWMHNGIAGAVLRSVTMPQFEPTPGYDPRQDPKLYEGRTEADQLYLDEARSVKESQYRSSMIELRNDDLKKVNINGEGMGIAATIFGGLPEGYLTGLGAMKVGATAGAALRASKAGRFAVAGAENVAGNVAAVGVQSAFDPYVSKDDYAMAAGMGLIAWGLHAPGLVRKEREALAESGQRHIDAAADSTQATREKVLADLGPETEPAALRAEAGRAEATAVKEESASATAELPANRRMDQAALFDADSEAASGPPTAKTKYHTERLTAYTEAGDAIKRAEALRTPVGREAVADLSEGLTPEQAAALPNGVHIRPELADIPAMAPALRALERLQSKLPDMKIIVGSADMAESAQKQARRLGQTYDGNRPMGAVISEGNTHYIAIDKQNYTVSGALLTAAHEFGHAVFHQYLPQIPSGLRAKMQGEINSFLTDLRNKDPKARFKRFREDDAQINDKPLRDDHYVASADEYSAEAFVRYFQRKAREAENPLKLDSGVVHILKSIWERVKALYDWARGENALPKDEAFGEFFDRVFTGTLADADKTIEAAPGYLDAGLTIPQLDAGIHHLPEATPAQKAEKQWVADTWSKAMEYPKPDASRLKSITDNNVANIASTGLLLLKSQNPVARMVASELLESASGATKRQSTAAIAKYLNEHKYMGNTINEVQSIYTRWRNAQGGNVIGDFWNGKLYRDFNRAVAEEIESRGVGKTTVESNPLVKEAADVYEATYERMRVAQKDAKTIGWAGLPESSTGYMPHRMSPEKVRNMTEAQKGVLHSALVDQFVNIEGFDMSFSANLASKYIDRVERRAVGGYDSPMNLHQTGAADVVEDSLRAMGLGEDEVRTMMQKYMRGGAGHTKGRLKLDLNAPHALEDGSTFKLMDLFETDQLKLVRGQAQRVSGEVALARHGIMGKPGLALMRRAMELGGDGEKATAKEFEAFDQVAAEFLGEPFGTQGGLWLNRALQLNSLARLGGMGFTQMAEFINGIAHVGVGRTMAAVSALPRLISEARTLAKGGKVENGILSSIEHVGGAEFGVHGYKMVFPFDNGELHYQTYGQESITMADRALRGATHAQGVLSFWRALHAAQSRGMAEQIVHKAARFIRDGGEDKALADMGITPEVAAKLKADLPNIAKWEGDRLHEFDITKASDPQAANDFIQAVHRGASQIIQSTFIGETGKWAHSGMARVMTQFRTFSITSIEKQWARQVGNHGPAAALGILLGSMSVAAPIYIARTMLAAQGRNDKDEYLDKQLSAAQIARATLNYVAMSGLAGDFLDAFTAVSGVGQATGGRTNSGSTFLGNVVAPAAGTINDVWKGIQNTKEGTNPHDLLKTMPFSRLPWMIPAINSLGD